jgi:hypothetical protein
MASSESDDFGAIGRVIEPAQLRRCGPSLRHDPGANSILDFLY